MLDEERHTRYDLDYYSFKSIWPPIFRFFSKDYPSGDFHLLDVGGGAGYFADYLLAQYPACRVTIFDLSRELLARNRPDPRKRLVLGDAVRLVESCPSVDVDVVSFNFVLHHLLAGDERGSWELRRRVLRQAAGLLRKGGRLLIIEALYRGIIHEDLPSVLIYRLTRSRRLAPLCRRFGSGAAGQGVLFQSGGSWRRMFTGIDLEVVDSYVCGAWEINPILKIPLNIASVRTGLFWCSPGRIAQRKDPLRLPEAEG